MHPNHTVSGVIFQFRDGYVYVKRSKFTLKVRETKPPVLPSLLTAHPLCVLLRFDDSLKIKNRMKSVLISELTAVNDRFELRDRVGQTKESVYFIIRGK